MSEHFKGFTLFNDVEDEALRVHNRARILVNIAEDNVMENGNITGKGAAVIVQYFQKVPTEERQKLYIKFQEMMNAAGFKITGA